MGLFDFLKNKKAAASPLEPREVFAAEAERVIRELNPGKEVTRVPGEYAFSVQGKLVIYLENTFLETREMSPKERRERVKRIACLPAGLPKTWEEARGSLVPVLRASSLVSATPVSPARKELVPFLSEVVAVDSPTSMAYVGASALSDWGVSLEEALAEARANLARHHSDKHVERYDAQSPYPLFHVAIDDDYQSSRLLLPGWLKSFEGKVPGRPIVAVPERGQLLVSGDGDERAIERLLTFGEREFQASPRRISPALYTCDEAGALAPYVAPVGHPARKKTRLAHLQFAQYEYAEQKEKLDKEHEEKEVDVYVANVLLVEPSEGEGMTEAMTVASWTEGVDVLLPVTGLVGMLGEKEGSALVVVPWEAVRELAGGTLEEVPELYPVRFRARAWPPPDVVEKLKGRAVQLGRKA